MSKSTKIAGAILPTLNDRTLVLEGKALRLYNNEGMIRTHAFLEARAFLKSRAKHFNDLAKDLDAKVMSDLKAGVKADGDSNHTLALGKKKNTSCKWKGYAAELLGVSNEEAEELVKETEHYSSTEVDCLVIDGRKT